MERHIHRFWLCLVWLSLGIALFFSAVALLATWNYFKLDGVAMASQVQWSTKELSPSKYALVAEYEYVVRGKGYAGRTELKTRRFLNPFAAEHEKKHCATKAWKVWYSKSNPEQCSLEKYFPHKEILHALLTLGVLGYFYCARNYRSPSYS